MWESRYVRILNGRLSHPFVNKPHLINMAFNSEVALFNLLEDAQTSAELLSVIDDYLDESEEVWVWNTLLKLGMLMSKTEVII